MKAIGYIRVSTQKQADTGVSLEAQEGSIHSYCKTFGLTLVELVEDAGKSAKTLNRPGMIRLLDMLERGEAEAVVVYKLDRAFRSIIDALVTMQHLKDKGIAFHSVTDKIDTSSAMGRAMLHILLSFGQLERELAGERTRDALQATKGSNGGNVLLDYRQRTGKLVTGQAPFGYRWSGEEGDRDRELETNNLEMMTVATILEWAECGWKPARIKRELEERGIAPRRGKVWHRTQIVRILQAEYY